MMMGYQILTDSCVDMTDEMKEKKEITLVPLRLRIGGREVVDDGTYRRVAEIRAKDAGSGKTGSSCPSPDDYLSRVDPEADRIYLVTGSAKLTGSFASANVAAQIMQERADGRKLTVIDSGTASAGQTFLVLKIMQWEKKGREFSWICKKIQKLTRQLETEFVLEDLSVLLETGRIPAWKTKIAGSLRICPVLRASHGEIVPCGQARGIKKALTLLGKKITCTMSADCEDMVVISHCDCPERAFALKMAIHDQFPYVRVRIAATGGIASLYAGAGGVVVAFMRAPVRED